MFYTLCWCRNSLEHCSASYRWDLKFVIVYDNDNAGNKADRNLIKKYPFYNLKIIHIPQDKNDSSVEDVFTHKEFISFIPSDIQENIKTINPNMSNSEFIKTVFIKTVKIK
jgi:DNA primase